MFYSNLIKYFGECNYIKELVDYNNSFRVFKVLDECIIKVNGDPVPAGSIFVNENLIIFNDFKTINFDGSKCVLCFNELVKCYSLNDVDLITFIK